MTLSIDGNDLLDYFEKIKYFMLPLNNLCDIQFKMTFHWFKTTAVLLASAI